MVTWKHPARVAFEALHARGNVLIAVATQAPGVDVPEKFRNETTLVLRYGANLTPPIVDMDIDDAKLSATLTFHGRWYRCVVPWYAIVQISDDSGDAPAPTAKPEPAPPKRGGHLRLV